MPLYPHGSYSLTGSGDAAARGGILSAGGAIRSPGAARRHITKYTRDLGHLLRAGSDLSRSISS